MPNVKNNTKRFESVPKKSKNDMTKTGEFKRMFSQDIVDSDNFYDLPFNSQLLYFHLGMHADIKGFVQPKKIARAIGLKIEDLRPLIQNNFIIPFESGVVVITHWNVNNRTREDREAPTRFTEEATKLEKHNNEYRVLQEHSRSSPAQYSIGKDRLGKDRETSGTRVKRSGKGTKIRGKTISEDHLEKIGQTILTWFNQTAGTRYKSIKGFKSNLAYWLNEYDEDDIKKALTAIGNGKWWAKNPSPTLLFRRKTPQGEPADYIGSLISGGGDVHEK